MNISDWNPEQYLLFERERTRPCLDLAARIHLPGATRIVDIGCGPGNSTMVLKYRWPNAFILGLDSSQAMLGRAVKLSADIRFEHFDATGDLTPLGKFDIVFSNAAVHHMPDKPRLLAKFFDLLNPGGVLAVQVPHTTELPFSVVLQTLVATDKWQSRLPENIYPARFHDYAYYYDILCGLPAEIDMWQTDYIQAMPSHAGIVEWYKGSGLRYYLAPLPDDSQRAELLRDYEAALKSAYPTEKNGAVLMPMRRIFFLARKKTENKS